MIMHWKHSAFVVSLALVWAGLTVCAASAAASSESATSTAKTNPSASVMTDSEFAKAAAQGGLAEVKLGELAENKATNNTVKELGQRMVDDHTKADESLKTAASQDNISTPAEMDAKDQATYDRLSKLSGTAFDRAYARVMVRDHVADIAAFRHEANNGKDASIKTFAAQTLPTLQEHLKLARQALRTVSPNANAQAEKKQS